MLKARGFLLLQTKYKVAFETNQMFYLRFLLASQYRLQYNLEDDYSDHLSGFIRKAS